MQEGQLLSVSKLSKIFLFARKKIFLGAKDRKGTGFFEGGCMGKEAENGKYNGLTFLGF